MSSVKYILEAVYPTAENGYDKRRIALPVVQSIDYSRRHAVVTQWSMGDKPFHAYSGVRGERIVLGGHSGLKTSFKDADFSDVSSDMSGPARFRRLEKFLEDFENEAAKAQKEGRATPKLVFRALWEEKNKYVDHEDFSWSRSVGRNKFSYSWQLVLMAYGEAKPGKAGGIEYMFRQTNEKLAVANTAVNYAGVAVAKYGTDPVRQTSGLLAQLREPLQGAVSVLQEVRTAARAGTSLREFPMAAVNDLYNVLSYTIIAAYDLWASTPFVDRQSARRQMVDVLGELERTRRATQTALGLNFVKVDPYTINFSTSSTGTQPNDRLAGVKTTSAALTPWPSKTVVRDGLAYRPYTVVGNESLMDIAQRTLGDRFRWSEIADANGMSSADTMGGGEPLAPGIVILVPSGDPLETLDQADIYGTTLLVRDGDLVGVGSQPSSFATVSGMACLEQSLRTRLGSIQGECAVDPNIGLPRAIGTKASEVAQATAAAEVVDQLISDTRIVSARDITVVDGGDSLVVESLVQPVTGGALRLTLPISAGG